MVMYARYYPVSGGGDLEEGEGEEEEEEEEDVEEVP